MRFCSKVSMFEERYSLDNQTIKSYKFENGKLSYLGMFFLVNALNIYYYSMVFSSCRVVFFSWTVIFSAICSSQSSRTLESFEAAMTTGRQSLKGHEAVAPCNRAFPLYSKYICTQYYYYRYSIDTGNILGSPSSVCRQQHIAKYIRHILFDIINDFFYALVTFFVELPLV